MERRGFFGVALSVLILASATGVASAQGGARRGGGGMIGRGGSLQLLRVPEVQTELKMTPEQIGKIDAKQQETRQALQDMFQGGGGQLSPEERQKRTDAMQAIQTKAVAGILDATQQKRFRQLELQQQGPLALARKDVATELKLTEEQSKQVAEIQRASGEEMRAAMQGVDFRNMSAEDRTKMMTKMQQSQKAAGDKVAALLTDAQKTQWKEMLGAPFTFPATGFGGRPGGARNAAPAAPAAL